MRLSAPIRTGTGPSCKPKESHRHRKIHRPLRRRSPLKSQRNRLTAEDRRSGSHNSFHGLRSPALQAAVRRIQDFLILPAFLAGNRKLGGALNSRSEGIHLPRVSALIRYCLPFDDGSVATKFQSNRVLYVQPVVGAQRSVLTDNFNWRAVAGAV